MAINPDFVFTDPVAAQQAVQMFQLQRAAEDALRRNAQENIRTFAQENIARENAGQQRAYTQAQLAQRDKELAQAQRQFDTTQDYRLKALDQNRTLAEADIKAEAESRKGQRAEFREDEIFSALQRDVAGDDPPTDLEFQAKTAELPEYRKTILDNVRRQRVDQLNRQADIADGIAANWENKLRSIPPGEEGMLQRDALISSFEKSKDKNYVAFDPSSGRFISLLRRPRADSVIPTGRAGGTSGILSIEELRNRIRGNIGAAPIGGPQFPPVVTSPSRSQLLQLPRVDSAVPTGVPQFPSMAAPTIPTIPASPELMAPIQYPPPAPMRDPYNIR